MARTTPATCTDCPRCRARAIGPGPYTPAQLIRLTIEQPRPERDPDVAAAEQARELFDALDRNWKRLAQAKATADLRGNLAPPSVDGLTRTKHTPARYATGRGDP